MSLIKRFRWWDQKRQPWVPRQMVTRHLFFTVRMIWNHTMPKEVRSALYIKHRLNPDIYTPQYLEQALRNLIPELLTRTDLDESWEAEIARWRAYFNRRLGGDDSNVLQRSGHPIALLSQGGGQ